MNRFKEGDRVLSVSNNTWKGPMVVEKEYDETGIVIVYHPNRGTGGFHRDDLILEEVVESPLMKALS